MCVWAKYSNSGNSTLSFKWIYKVGYIFKYSPFSVTQFFNRFTSLNIFYKVVESILINNYLCYHKVEVHFCQLPNWKHFRFVSF